MSVANARVDGICSSRVGEISDSASCTVSGASGNAASSSTSACSLGTLTSFSCYPAPCTVPSVTDAHAVNNCGSDVAEIADSASCTVDCATGETASIDIAARSFGMLAFFTCIHSPCAVPSVTNTHADDTCGSWVTSIANSASFTVDCAARWTASSSAEAFARRVLASFTCDISPFTVPSMTNAHADGIGGSGVTSIADSASWTVNWHDSEITVLI